MKEQYLTANDLQIAYYIKSPERTNTIFFIHGNSSSSRVWRKQFESDLLANYRLISLDLPNHGNSDALEAGADFSLPGIAKIMGEAIKQLTNHKPYIICGSSIGTNIVAEMMNAGVSPEGLVIAGPCIIGEGFDMNKMVLEGAHVTAVFSENAPEELVNKYAAETSLSTDKRDRNNYLNDYHSVKGQFRSSLYATIASETYSDEIELLRKSNCPVCVVFGQDEKVVNTHYLEGAPLNLWNSTIYKIPGASHLVNIDAPQAFNKLVAEFVTDIFTTDAA